MVLNVEKLCTTCDTLLAAYGGPVYKFCRSLTYSREDAEDLFQETFLKVLEAPGKFQAAGSQQGFLFSTALFLFKDKKRKYARRQRIAPVTVLDEAVAAEDTVDEAILAEEELQLVRTLVEALPEKYKIPTILYYTLELPLPEIAAMLGIPAGTVKSRLFTARKLVEKGLLPYEK